MSDPDSLIAVIGMSGRFPGAADVESLWANLCAGTESIARQPAGADGYRPGYGALTGADEFDAEFFGYPPAQALILDPQQRLFLECAYEALERAGYGAPAARGSVGVFAGGATTDYRAAVEAQLPQLPFVDHWQVRLATAPDFLATRVAHKLTLTGPAVTVQTACSTSLVAVHLAAQALLAGDCQLALAGGAAVHVPPPQLSYTEGGIIAADGHCRAFDAAAAGTVGGSAAAVVLLKPLPEALADGDHIHAVLLGTAVNNDGGDAIGFTAPSVDGQARVVRAAQVVAGVAAESIGYLEAHGTGTRLGDPIEVAALTKAFRATTDRTGFCAIGSVKSNLGHTDAAAGVVGLIKAVLAVEHGEIPPTLHVREPNPHIDWAGSPFRVATDRQRWQPAAGPRRAGVSALGVGGTNAHVVIEQPPAAASAAPAGTPQLLLASARTEAALTELVNRYADHLRAHPTAVLADVAWTLQAGRQAYPLRRFVVASTPAEAVPGLRAAAGPREAAPELVGGGSAEDSPPPVVFMFPGQGGQHVAMASELYQHEPPFRAALDEVAQLALPGLALDLREVLFPEPTPAAAGWARERLATIAVGQPAVFAVEYALSQLLRDWGIQPAAVVGHSLGAVAAATLAGVLSLADAVALVVHRGGLLQSLPAGAMVAVALPEAELLPMLPAGLSVAAINGPRRCAVAGPAAAVRDFTAQLRQRGIEARLLSIATAGHSALVDPIMAPLRELVDGLSPRPAQLAFLSDTTGEWATADELITGDYWANHLRSPVRFSQALATLADQPDAVLVEVGPGRTLATLAQQHPALAGRTVTATLPHPLADASDHATLLAAVGQLWSVGVPVHWHRLHPGRRRRVVLPTYPFQRRRYLVPRPVEAATAPAPLVLGEPAPGADLAPLDRTPAGSAAASEGETAAQPDGQATWRHAFGQALGIADVPAYADLFQLGGDSLTATRLAGWVRRQYAVSVTTADIIRARTPVACARLVEERSCPRMVENQREDDRRPRRRGTPWLSRRRPVTDPVARLYCLPHSGGAAGEYLRWADQLPQLEVWGVNLPGRGSRLDEPPMESMTELAAGLVDAVTFTGRFGLFGHSFGALLAYHVAQRLREVGRAQPSQLILSSYPPPHLPRQLRVLSDLPDQEFLRQLDEAYGGVPAELQADPELMELVVPAYRADLRILERYTDPQLPPLSCPMLVIGGEQDRFDADELGQWARHTTGECLVRMLPGGHFYFRPDNEPLRALLYEQLGVSAPAA